MSHQATSCDVYLDAALVLEGGGQVGGHLDAEYLHGPVLKAPLPHKVLGGQEGGSAPVRGGAALQLGQGGVDQGGRLDLVQAVLILNTIWKSIEVDLEYFSVLNFF